MQSRLTASAGTVTVSSTASLTDDTAPLAPTDTHDTHAAHDMDPQLSRQRTKIIWSVLCGFTGYYYLRTNLVVASSLLLASLPGTDRADLGWIMSGGYLFYALGKVASGPLIDRHGGARMFLAGYAGSLVMCALFTLVPSVMSDQQPSGRQVWLLGACWSFNRLAQSAGWGAVVKIVSGWFPGTMHGRVFGLASLSYGVGDVLVRASLGLLLMRLTPVEITAESAGVAWRRLFYASMVCAVVLLVPTARWMRQRGDSDDHLHDVVDASDGKGRRRQRRKSFTKADHHPTPTLATTSTTAGTLWRLAGMPKFWLLLCMAPCLALIRETFISWTAVYFGDILRLSPSDAAVCSMIFPLFGTVSTLAGGWAMDWLAPRKRGLIAVVCLSCLSTLLAAGSVLSASIDEQFEPSANNAHVVWLAALLLSAVALCLLAPFSFVDGVLVTALAGSSGAGVAVGIISCVGYTGAILAGHTMGLVADQEGWSHVLFLLACVSAVSFVLAVAYWLVDVHELGERNSRRVRFVERSADYQALSNQPPLSVSSSAESIAVQRSASSSLSASDDMLAATFDK